MTVPRTLDGIDWDAWVPVDEATLLFVLRGEEVLLIRKKRGLWAGKINGPGGRIELGETPLEAAVRETQEELLITPLAPTPAGVISFQFLDGYSIRAHLFISKDFLWYLQPAGLKAAYRQKVKEAHPDRFNNLDSFNHQQKTADLHRIAHLRLLVRSSYAGG